MFELRKWAWRRVMRLIRPGACRWTIGNHRWVGIVVSETDAERQKKQKRNDMWLFVVAAVFIVGAIAAMFMIDYYYAAENQPGQHLPGDVADEK